MNIEYLPRLCFLNFELIIISKTYVGSEVITCIFMIQKKYTLKAIVWMEQAHLYGHRRGRDKLSLEEKYLSSYLYLSQTWGKRRFY